jgi:hemerythrin-like domain-containing protein
MTQAFRPIPEPPPAGEDPLQALAGANQRLLGHCATLRRLGLYLNECGFDTQASEALQQACRFFNDVLPRHHADEDIDLAPALLESMAGSDAVCLRDITDALAREHRALRQLWSALQPALDEVAAGRAQSLPVHEVETFVERCQACVAREESELLPMASRLLADGQIIAIGNGMRRRRQSPT